MRSATSGGTASSLRLVARSCWSRVSSTYVPEPYRNTVVVLGGAAAADEMGASLSPPPPTTKKVLLILTLTTTTATAGPCVSSSPLLVVYNRLPWFESRELHDFLKNRSTVSSWDYQFTSWDKDAYGRREAMATDAGASHGDAVRVARTIREIQQRSTPKQRVHLAWLERSFSYLEVPDVAPGSVAWVNVVEDPVERAARAFAGTPKDLDACVSRFGARKCVPCESMTQWFCGGGPMCSVESRGLAALVRAKLVLARDYLFVGVRERWSDSIAVLKLLLPGFFPSSSSSSSSSDQTTEAKKKPSSEVLDRSSLVSGHLAEATKEAIRAANPLDVELYDHAVANLDIVAQNCLGRPSMTPLVTVPKKKKPSEEPDEDTKKKETKISGGLGALARFVAPSSSPDGLAGTCIRRHQMPSTHRRLNNDTRRVLKSKSSSSSSSRSHAKKKDDKKKKKIAADVKAALSSPPPMTVVPAEEEEDEERGSTYCFPTAVGVGASRAGIGLVGALLHEHAGVRTTGSVHYFGRALRRGKRGVLTYVRSFPMSDTEVHNGAIAFEASPEYAVSRPALTEMVSFLGPRVKIIFAIREPTARAYDDFWRYARAGRLFQRERELFLCYEGGSSDGERRRLETGLCLARGDRVPPRSVSPLVFDAYARQVILDAWEPELRPVARRAALNDSLPLNYEFGELNDNVFSKSLYASQITRLYGLIDPSNVHVVVYEHLLSPDRGPGIVHTILAFLGVDRASKKQRKASPSYTADFIAGVAAAHVKQDTAPYPPVLRKTRRLLEAFYTVDIDLLKRQLPNLDLPW